MLVLTRGLNQSILIGDDVEIKVVAIRGTGDGATVRLGIKAPRAVRVLRREVLDDVAEENRAARSSPLTANLEALLAEVPWAKSGENKPK